MTASAGVGGRSVPAPGRPPSLGSGRGPPGSGSMAGSAAAADRSAMTGSRLAIGPAATVPAATVAAALRSSASATLVDRRQPVPVLRQAPPDSIEVASLERAADRAHLARADLPMVDLDHRTDLDAGPAQEDLIRDVQLGPVDRADLGTEPLPRRELEEGAARDALQDVVVD